MKSPWEGAIVDSCDSEPRYTIGHLLALWAEWYRLAEKTPGMKADDLSPSFLVWLAARDIGPRLRPTTIMEDQQGG